MLQWSSVFRLRTPNFEKQSIIRHIVKKKTKSIWSQQREECGMEKVRSSGQIPLSALGAVTLPIKEKGMSACFI